jgi:hypothetical protein
VPQGGTQSRRLGTLSPQYHCQPAKPPSRTTRFSGVVHPDLRDASLYDLKVPDPDTTALWTVPVPLGSLQVMVTVLDGPFDGGGALVKVQSMANDPVVLETVMV